MGSHGLQGFPAGERAPGRPHHSQTACHSRHKPRHGRAAGPRSKDLREQGVKERAARGRRRYVAALKTKPSSAALTRPVRTRHQSTKKRRASATRICLPRCVLAARNFSRAQMTPR